MADYMCGDRHISANSQAISETLQAATRRAREALETASVDGDVVFNDSMSVNCPEILPTPETVMRAEDIFANLRRPVLNATRNINGDYIVLYDDITGNISSGTVTDCAPMPAITVDGKMHKPKKVKEEKTFARYGIEKTFVLDMEQFTDRQETAMDRILAEVIRSVRQDPDMAALPVWNIGCDPGCIEIPSKVLDTMEQGKHYFEELSRIVLNKNKKMRHRSDYVFGPGGHIHAEKQGMLHTSAVNMFTLQHPTLNALCHPEDDINAKSPAWNFLRMLCDRDDGGKWLYELGQVDAPTKRVMIRDTEYDYTTEVHTPVKYWRQEKVFSLKPMESLDILEMLYAEHYDSGVKTEINYRTDLRGWSFRNSPIANFQKLYENGAHHMTISDRDCNPTLEFRMFESARDWDEQRHHIEFVMAIMKYCKKNQKELNKFKPMPWAIAQSILKPPNEKIAEFEEMIHKLGLDWHQFKQYVPNIKKRDKMERKALKGFC